MIPTRTTLGSLNDVRAAGGLPLAVGLGGTGATTIEAARLALELGSAALAGAGDFDISGAAAAVAGALTTHVADTGNPHAVTAAQVGLGNVDNTTDVAKPVSTAVRAALDLKADAGALTTHVADTGNPHAVTAAQVGAYTVAQVDGFLAAKAALVHIHDDRYYTEAEVDGFLAGRQPINTDLTALSTLAAATGIAVRAGPGNWSVRTLLASDVPALDAAKVTTGTFDPVRLATGLPAAGSYPDGSGAWTALPTSSIPGGSGAEVQYRAGPGSFGAVANVTRSSNGNLLLAAGSTPGSLADGELFQGSQKTLSGYLNGLTHRFVGCLFAQTADATAANTTTATTLVGAGVGSVTLPANFLVAGKTLRLRLVGRHSTQATPGTLTVRMKLGSTVLGSFVTTPTGSVTDGYFLLDYLLTCRTTGGSGTAIGQGRFEFGTASAAGGTRSFVSTAATTIDTTASQTVDVTAQWQTASTTNSVTITNAILEALN